MSHNKNDPCGPFCTAWPLNLTRENKEMKKGEWYCKTDRHIFRKIEVRVVMLALMEYCTISPKPQHSYTQGKELGRFLGDLSQAKNCSLKDEDMIANFCAHCSIICKHSYLGEKKALLIFSGYEALVLDMLVPMATKNIDPGSYLLDFFTLHTHVLNIILGESIK